MDFGMRLAAAEHNMDIGMRLAAAEHNMDIGMLSITYKNITKIER